MVLNQANQIWVWTFWSDPDLKGLEQVCHIVDLWDCGDCGTTLNRRAWSGEGFQGSTHDPSFNHFLLLSLKIKRCTFAPGERRRGWVWRHWLELTESWEMLLFSVSASLFLCKMVGRWEYAPFGENGTYACPQSKSMDLIPKAVFASKSTSVHYMQ